MNYAFWAKFFGFVMLMCGGIAFGLVLYIVMSLLEWPPAKCKCVETDTQYQIEIMNDGAERSLLVDGGRLTVMKRK